MTKIKQTKYPAIMSSEHLLFSLFCPLNNRVISFSGIFFFFFFLKNAVNKKLKGAAGTVRTFGLY